MPAGGREFKIPGNGTVRFANITADKGTGIGLWTKAQFVNRFKTYADSSPKYIAAGQVEYQSIMPWYRYAGMKTGDLEAIYAYIRTIKPIKNKVSKFTSM